MAKKKEKIIETQGVLITLVAITAVAVIAGIIGYAVEKNQNLEQKAK